MSLQTTKIFKQYGIEFKLEKITSETLAEEEFSITPTNPPDCIIPNQLWKGYYNQQVFDEEKTSEGNIISGKSFKNFGVSIQNFGCAVCCSVAAINALKNTNYTVYDLYNKNAFVWKQSVNKNGLPNGVTLMKFRDTKKWGVDSGNTKHIAYDIGRNYGWCKGSKNYTATSSIITDDKVNTYANKFYQPTSSEPEKGYKSTNSYNQATAAYTKGTLADLFDSRDYSRKYRAAQAQAIERIKDDLKNNTQSSFEKVDILYINSPVSKSGHYILAISAAQNYTTHSYADVIVWDPCPTKAGGFDNKNSYYGRQITLMEAMSRIKADISDGIRTIQTCTIV